jgi:radical S-adenosyl methionine domain-containing protein 2
MMKTTMSRAAIIPALNFHVWQPCNMACRYCFAEFRETVPQLSLEKSLLRERALKVVREAARAGIEKLTFVGGEPTLCPWLFDLLDASKRADMVTMLVTNGSRLNDEWLGRHAPLLDWVGLSIDSLHATTNIVVGRTIGRRVVPDGKFYRNLALRLTTAGIRLKVNTVVSAANWTEDFSDFMSEIKPARWKVLKVLQIAGENDAAFPACTISAEQFGSFIERHRPLVQDGLLIPEDNEAMTGSYLMVDPLGRFFDNPTGAYRYSSPIWKVGWNTALSEIAVCAHRFEGRGGLYDWGSIQRRSSLEIGVSTR